jgi:hypothetical protein
MNGFLSSSVSSDGTSGSSSVSFFAFFDAGAGSSSSGEDRFLSTVFLVVPALRKPPRPRFAYILCMAIGSVADDGVVEKAVGGLDLLEMTRK